MNVVSDFHILRIPLKERDGIQLWDGTFLISSRPVLWWRTELNIQGILNCAPATVQVMTEWIPTGLWCENSSSHLQTVELNFRRREFITVGYTFVHRCEIYIPTLEIVSDGERFEIHWTGHASITRKHSEPNWETRTELLQIKTVDNFGCIYISNYRGNLSCYETQTFKKSLCGQFFFDTHRAYKQRSTSVQWYPLASFIGSSSTCLNLQVDRILMWHSNCTRLSVVWSRDFKQRIVLWNTVLTDWLNKLFN